MSLGIKFTAWRCLRFTSNLQEKIGEGPVEQESGSGLGFYQFLVC